MSTRTERGAGGEWTLPLRDALLLAGGGGSMVLTTHVAALPGWAGLRVHTAAGC